MRNWMLAGFSACALCASATVREVDPVNGTDDVDSPVWATLSFAVEHADAGDEIVLAKGSHRFTEVTLVVEKAVTIRGAGEAWETAIDGQYGGNVNNRHHLELAAAGAVLHSLSVTNCYDGTIATLKVSADAIVSNVAFSAINVYSAGALQMSAGLATHCWISNCAARNYRLVYLQGISRMENCYIGSNTCDVYAGGIVELGSDDAVLRNCTIVDNVVKERGAVYANSGATVWNNLVWGNVNTAGATANWSANGSGKTGQWDYNCTTPTAGLGGAHNVGSDPLLRDDRMHFKGFSPCRGAADPDNHPAFDIEGQVRTDPSIGAFEYVATPTMEAAIGVSAATGSLPEGITVTALVDGGTAPYSYSWDFDGDGKEDAVTAVAQIQRAGSFTPLLTVTDATEQSIDVAYDGALVIHAAGAATYYVDGVGGQDDASHGGTPENAWKTLSYALASPLVFDGDEIVLLKGSHRFTEETLKVEKAVTIRGAGEAWETSIDGQYSGNVNNRHHLELTAAGAVLHSLSVTNCYDGTIATLKVSADAIVSNVIFSAINIYAAGALQMSEGLATHCWIRDCSARNYRLVYLQGTSRMENCYIGSNACDVNTGGIVELYSNAAVLRNCTIANNTSMNKGAVYVSYSSGSASVWNNLIWGNADVSGDTANWSVNAAGRTGSWASNCTSPIEGLAGANNIEKNPLFLARVRTPWRLSGSSPCRHAGDDALAPAGTDIEGRPRKFGRHVDIGCSECMAAGFGVVVR